VRLEREHAISGERGVLLQELTHRVKNSLQIIAAMVSNPYYATYFERRVLLRAPLFPAPHR
jgi:two-component sensor histidine kinase